MIGLICISFSLTRSIIVAGLVTDEYLTHYWPFSNATMTDSVDHADMHQGMNTKFVSDRFGCPNSALNLNGGWTYLTPGVYFNTSEFTISVWIYPQSVGSWSRVIDFGNGAFSDNIFLSQDSGSNFLPELCIYRGSNYIGSVRSSNSLALSQWQFLVATFNGTLMRIYVNGVLTESSNLLYILPSLVRINNYIGKSNWNWDGFSSSYLDDLRFYNKSLTQAEIVQLMNSNSNTFFVCLFSNQD